MTLVIGTDEAGYGPNLGPLVIGATAWRVTAGPEAAEPALAAALEATGAMVGGRLWGDSKQIYRGGVGLDLLERGVLAALALTGGEPTSWPELAAAVGIDRREPLVERSALDGLTVPQHGPPAAIRALAGDVRRQLASRGVAVVAVRCRLVSPGEFNGLLDRGLNKSDILSAATLELAASLEAAEATAAEPVMVWCDRHGGRRRYAPQVTQAFAAPLVQPLEETPLRSAYRLGPGRSIEFTVGGEARLPVAVASMTAKYVRELAMLAFNAFWGARQPGLVATAGYPVDAGRWRQDATAAVDRSGVAWDAIWRRA